MSGDQIIDKLVKCTGGRGDQIIDKLVKCTGVRGSDHRPTSKMTK